MEPIPQEILDRAAKFKGDGRQLEAALGAYVIGQLYGWRALAMMHTYTTRARHQKILGATFAELVPEETELTRRLVGIRVARKVGAFWKVATSAKYGTDRHMLNSRAD